MGTIQIFHRYQKPGGEDKTQQAARDPEYFQLEDYLYYPSWLKKDELASDLEGFGPKT